MIVNDSSKIIHFDNVVLPETEQDILSFPSYDKHVGHSVVKVDGKYYYAKIVRTQDMINELIGTYYAKLIGLDTVDYLIGKANDSDNCYYHALSEYFYKPGFDYFIVPNYYHKKPDDTRVYSEKLDRFFVTETSVLDLVDNPKLVRDVLKMTALDIKTGQIDRHENNVILRCNDGLVEMEKLFDYGCAYGNPPYPEGYYYDNPFLIVRKNTVSLWKLATKYPQISECAAMICDVPLYDVLKSIEERFNIKIEDRDIVGYIRQDKNNSRILRKVL